MLENVKIYPYQRTGKGEHKRRVLFRLKKNTVKRHLFPGVKLGKLALAGELCFCFAGFFLGRAVLLGDLMPFGIAFAVAAIQVFGRFGLMSVPAVIAGLITISKGIPLTGSILVVICALLLMRVISLEPKKQWLILPGLVLAVTIIVKTSLLVFTNPLAASYSYFCVLFEAVFAALFTLVTLNGLTALGKRIKKGQALASDEIFCVLIIFGGLIAGTGDLGGGLASVKGTLSRLAILLASLVGGAGVGAAAGAVLGVIPGLAYTVVPALAPAYSFAGFIAGLCRGLGKAGVATGFLLANIILTVYVTGYGNLVSTLVESGLSTMFFLLVPQFIIKEAISSMGLEVADDKEHPAGKALLKEAFKEKIKNWALVFRELSQTFEQLSTTAGSNEEQKIQGLINQVGQKVCDGCAFYRTCWEREFYRTYQSLIDLFAQVEVYGNITRDNLPDEIKKRCARTKELAVAVCCLYETYQINRYWSGRLLESREIVSEQLRGIGEVIAGLPGELEFNVEVGDSGLHLRKKLKDAGVRAESLSISSQGGDRIEVSLTHPACGGRMRCRSVIAPFLSAALERNFSPPAVGCAVNGEGPVCRLRFSSDLNYRLILGVSGMGKGGSLVSGDNYAFFCLKGGRFGLALSDGMGVGPRAALESGTTLSLLRHLLDLGFGQELAIKTVNSILVLRSPGESFATVDLVMVDLYNGQADFIKIGAVPTYLLRDGQVSQIKASSLPVGIIEDFEIVSQARLLEPGDMLVMLTDGMFEACDNGDEHGEWIIKVLEDAAGLPPQEMAELLLKLAQTGSGGVARVPDDMTVVVARLEKQKSK
ncbi:stage II sporulation protein E [Pelotomaculum isophthalicicum JI]|uniref:Stage II sporulation protein E n=1 Tax=Pelotomaculum isophthalicicum JI TaxID=947010 RepID=A0A9X4H504_9FIRM|nr:stage II sporulation protein E [Pelotomaculum isophthalicicum]MDF9409228.1 stage II sporulation protein E [Pelotomaculum isophthalicicum JI]